MTELGPLDVHCVDPELRGEVADFLVVVADEFMHGSCTGPGAGAIGVEGLSPAQAAKMCRTYGDSFDMIPSKHTICLWEAVARAAARMGYTEHKESWGTMSSRGFDGPVPNTLSQACWVLRANGFSEIWNDCEADHGRADLIAEAPRHVAKALRELA